MQTKTKIPAASDFAFAAETILCAKRGEMVHILADFKTGSVYAEVSDPSKEIQDLGDVEIYSSRGLEKAFVSAVDGTLHAEEKDIRDAADLLRDKWEYFAHIRGVI